MYTNQRPKQPESALNDLKLLQTTPNCLKITLKYLKTTSSCVTRPETASHRPERPHTVPSGHTRSQTAPINAKSPKNYPKQPENYLKLPHTA